MIRTSIRIPAELLAAAQAHARATGRTFTDLLADALRLELERGYAAPRVCEPLPTYRGAGLVAGVDLADSAALEDVMRGE